MDTQPQESPIPDAQPEPQKEDIATINFTQACEKIVEGKRITKLEWNDDKIFGYLKDNVVTLHKEDGDHIWVISLGDLVGTDYIIL